MPMSSVAATVNGEPILVGTIFADSRRKLDAVRKTVKGPEQAQQLREMELNLLRQRLPQYIEQTLMVQAVKVKLKPEQWKGVEAQLDQHFEEQTIPQLKEKLQAETLVDLEVKLQQNGASLEAFREMVSRDALAKQYMSTMLGDPIRISRPEMLAEYQQRKAEFSQPWTKDSKYSQDEYEKRKAKIIDVALVRFQQIQISFRKAGGKENALAQANEAFNALSAGQLFGDVEVFRRTGRGQWRLLGDDPARQPDVRLAVAVITAPAEPAQRRDSHRQFLPDRAGAGAS